MRASRQELQVVALEAVRGAVASPVHLGSARIRSLPRGERSVSLPQLHLGVPVFEHGATVVFGSNGRARLVASRMATELPLSVEPTLDATDAVEVASRLTHLAYDAARAQLIVWAGPDGARLAWATASMSVAGFPFRPVVVVDARSGEAISLWNAVHTLGKAQVYPTNPVASPMLADVTLQVTEGAPSLDSAFISSRNCVDQKTVTKIYGYDIHVCDLAVKAIPDENGDFLIPPADDTEPEDAFAEVSLFHHASRAHAYFQQFDPSLDVNGGKPLLTVSNLRLAVGLQQGSFGPQASDPNVALEPFQNAFFSPEDPIFSKIYGISGGALWFGQGPLKDYSYDGDVVYHEFTHAVVEATLKLSQGPHLDEFGASFSPGSMNEGLADYFSSAITGDPNVGEYAVQDIGKGGIGIRSLDAADACPTDVAGEVHQDSVMFSAALWEVRAGLEPAERLVLDGAVFAAMTSSPTGDLAYEDFVALMTKSVAASPLGQPVADKLDAAFTARGLLPKCNRVLAYNGKTMEGPSGFYGRWMSPGSMTNGVGAKNPGWTPGVVQFKVPLGKGALALKGSFAGYDSNEAAQGGKPREPKLAVGFGQPVQFTYKPLAVPADVLVVDAVGGEAEVAVPEGATEAYVMLLNTAAGDTTYGAVEFDVKLPLSPFFPPVPEEPVLEPTKEPALVITGGCATSPGRSPERSGLALGVGILAVAAAGAARRRRSGGVARAGSGKSAV